MSNKESLRAFILNYPGNMLGFLRDLGQICYELGDNWKNFGKEYWGNVLIQSGDNLSLIAEDLFKIEKEYKKEQNIEDDIPNINSFEDYLKYLTSVSYEDVIEYVYNEKGERIVKKSYNAGQLSQITYYLGSVIYTQPVNNGTQGAISAQEYEIQGAGGRLGTFYRQIPVYAYELTDHLGNVRALVRDNVATYTCTMEDNSELTLENPRVQELQYFQKIAGTVKCGF